MKDKHSGTGIASFIISLVMGVFILLLILVAGVAQASIGDCKDTEMAEGIFGVLILGCLFGNLVGVGLGIAGLAQKDRKHVFPILGTTINAVTVVGMLFLSVIGNLLK
jgi:hypothetical protein